MARRTSRNVAPIYPVAPQVVYLPAHPAGVPVQPEPAKNRQFDAQQFLLQLAEKLQQPTQQQPVRNTITVKEAAEYVGVSQDTIRKMIRERKIPFVQVRGRYLFRIDTLEDWMRRQEEASIR